MDTLNKLAFRVCLPLFAIACVTEPPSQKLHTDISRSALWLFSSPAAIQIFQLLAWGIAAFLAIYVLLDILAAIVIRITGRSPFVAFGIALNLFTVAAFCKLGTVDPLPTVNVFWELALGSLGLVLLDLGAVQA